MDRLAGRRERERMSRVEEPSAGGGAAVGVALESLCRHARSLEGVRRAAIREGDRIIVRTRNSVYLLHALEGGAFAVSGGWFDREHSPRRVVRVNGCTWGGRAINERLVAAPGLFLEFGNGVVTTRIQRVEVVPASPRRSSQ